MFKGNGKTEDVHSVLEACSVLGENGDGVLCVDASGTVRYANAAAARILTQPVGELLGRDAASLLGADYLSDRGGSARPSSGATFACRHNPVFLNPGMPGTFLVLHDGGRRERSGKRFTWLARRSESGIVHLSRSKHGVAGPLPLSSTPPDSEPMPARARAAAEGQLELVYQPQQRFDTHALVGVEALLYRRHPYLGEIRLPCLDCGNVGGNERREMFPWSEAYETCIPLIDTQHRALADLVNRLGRGLHGACAAAGDLLDEIADYTDYHFRSEEAFMSRYGVVDAHADLHRRCHGEGLMLIRRRIASWRKGKDDLQAFCSEFVCWLAYHMLAEDKSLGEQIAAIDDGVAPIEAYRSTMLSAALECR